MTAVRKPHTGALPKTGIARRRVLSGADGAFVTRHELDERVEDAALNAIADERAAGPFVPVSLDDL